MNIKLFKKLIKEAVTEVIYEELPEIINEALKKQGKQQISEGKTMSFTSADINPLSKDVRESLAAKMGADFGFNPPQRSDLKVIDAVDPSTGDKVNPYLAFINDAANNMTAHDRSGLRNLD